MKDEKKKLFLAHWQKNISVNLVNAQAITYPAGSMSLITYAADNLHKMMERKVVNVYVLESFIKSWQVDQPKPPVMNVFYDNYGIGDHIAFSAMLAYLDELNISVKVWLTEKEMPVYKYFRPQNFTLIKNSTPLCSRLTMMEMVKLKKQKRLAMEWAAVEAKEKNWYDAMFERIGLPEAPAGFRKPRLRLLHQNYIPNSVYINHRASTQVRSSHFSDFYFPVKAVFPDFKIFVGRYDLTETDQQFIDSTATDVQIIEAGSIDDHLKMLSSFTMVVGTDSAAIHFREGISMPAVGVYGAFTTDSRTKHYLYTHSFNVKSGCRLQPCFDHSAKCKRAKHNIAPCQSGEKFQHQLTEALKPYA